MLSLRTRHTNQMLVFDIETNGLLDEGDTVHCLVLKDLDTGCINRYDETGKHDRISEGVKALMYADTIWGHNVIAFDIPFIIKCFIHSSKLILSYTNLYSIAASKP